MKNTGSVPVFVYIVLLLCLHTGLRLIIHSPTDNLHRKHKILSQADSLHRKHKIHSPTDSLHQKHRLYSSGGATNRTTATDDDPSDDQRSEGQNVAGKPSGQGMAAPSASFDQHSENTELLSGGHFVGGTRVCRNTAFLLVAVCSAAENFRNRDVIRRTWASGDSDAVEVVFVVGWSRKRKVNESVRSEEAITGDLIRVMVADSYGHLTLKTIALLNWTKQSCAGAKYVLKVDDDTYVNVPRLLAELRHLASERFIMGDIIAGARPDRSRKSKWYTPPAAYRPSTYPDYVSGSAYLISADLIRNLYEAARSEPLFWIEDVFITGICAAKIRATLIHNAGFKSFVSTSVRPSVLSRIIALHRVDPEQMIELWHRLKQDEKGM